MPATKPIQLQGVPYVDPKQVLSIPDSCYSNTMPYFGVDFRDAAYVKQDACVDFAIV